MAVSTVRIQSQYPNAQFTESAILTAKNFAPVSGTVSMPNVLVMPASLGVNSVTEVVNLARSKPGKPGAALI